MFTVYVHDAKDHLAQKNPPVGRDYFSLIDARIVAEMELRSLMANYPGATLSYSRQGEGDDDSVMLWLVTIGPLYVQHIYILNQDMEMQRLHDPAIPAEWVDRVLT